MASNFHKSDTAANAEAVAVAALFNNGYLRIYSGTQPANANTALSGNTLLAELRFGATAFGAPTAGLLIANAITAATAAATGTATFYRCLESDGSTVLCDGSVGTAGADMNIGSTAIQSGATVSVTTFTHQVTE
jgi:hypothetical protein